MNDRVFTASLVATAPLHPWSGEGGGSAALAVSRDCSGRPYLPGTQITGRLREVATRLCPALGWTPPCVALAQLGAEADPADGPGGAPCGCPVCQAFGARAAAGDAEGSASRIWCFDAPLEAYCGGRVSVRHGVGIDRATGAAAAGAGALYDTEWLPAGSAFRLRVEIEHGAPAETEAVLALALSEWREGRGRIGGGAARGGGAFELREAQFRRADLSGADGVLDFLGTPRPERRGRSEPEWLNEQVRALRTRPAPAAAALHLDGVVRSFAELSCVLRFDGAMLVGDPGAAVAHGVSFAPLHAGPDWTHPVLPGSSLRGVLRAQVERIARTLATRSAADRAARAAARGDALEAFAAAPGACNPFAPPGGDGEVPALRSCAALREAWEKRRDEERRTGRRGEGTRPPPDCVACSLFGAAHQGSRLWIADAPLEGEPVYLLRDFLAIDRFTGGAFGGAKFDALPLYGPAFRVSLLLWEPRSEELAALAFAFRDLHDGLTGVGAHGSRGFGRARVKGEVALTEGRIGGRGWHLDPPEPPGKPSGVFDLARWAGTPEALVGFVRRKGWAGEFANACARPRRLEAPPAAGPGWADAYFGKARPGGASLESLYPPHAAASGREVGDVG